MVGQQFPGMEAVTTVTWHQAVQHFPVTEAITTVTGHAVEEALASSVVGLQEAAVHGPVQVGDEGGGAAALAHLLVALAHGVQVHRAVVGAHRQVGAVRGELQLVDGLLPVLDVHHLCHVSAGVIRGQLGHLLGRRSGDRSRPASFWWCVSHSITWFLPDP